MRKTWIAIVATVVLGVTIYGGYHAYGAYEQSKQLESDLFLANVEALSQNETSPSDTGPGDTFKCKKCGAIRKNKMAEDDDMDEIIKLSAKHN